MYNLGSPDVWIPGSEPQRSPLNSAVPGTAAHSKVKVTQQTVHDSGFVQQDHYTQQRLDIQ